MPKSHHPFLLKWFISVRGNNILAFALWRTYEKGDGKTITDWTHVKITELLELYVSPELRGRGIGKTLIAEVERIGIEDGADYLSIDVLSRNRIAVSLYESIGCSAWFMTMVKKLER